MNKGILIVVGVAVIVVILGIAFLPDEVLIESPSIDTSEGQAPEEKKIVLSESIISIEETEPEEAHPVEQVEETVPKGKEIEGKVIEVKIKDGVGTQEK